MMKPSRNKSQRRAYSSVRSPAPGRPTEYWIPNTASRPRRAFTLVELMVSMALITLIASLVFSMTSSTASLWKRTTGSVEQFRSANLAFEAMTRRLGQATLNTYWDYDSVSAPKKYVRQSDLRFITGRMEALMGVRNPRRPLHAVFFQAPLGTVSSATNFGGLENLLNTAGYYLEFNDDSALRPGCINTTTVPPRYRYRLMEVVQPSDNLLVYRYTAGQPLYNRKDWFQNAVNIKPISYHVLAENVIALVIQPKLSKKDEQTTGKVLTKDYNYDSSATVADPDINPKNQLPPVVQVTLVAIDEPSAQRLANGATPPSFDPLLDTLFVDTTKYDQDLVTLQQTLNSQHIAYRVFTSSVSLRGAKWSRK